MGERNSGFGGTVIEDFEVAPSFVELPVDEVISSIETPEIQVSLEPVIESEQAPIEQPEQQKQPQSFEDNVAAVMELVGGRIFTYKSHSGTAAEMAAMCPMARMAFMRGPEFAISFLEKFDGTPADESKKEEPKPEEIEQPKSDPEIGEPQKESDKIEVKAPETKREIPVTTVMVAQVAISEAKNSSVEVESEPTIEVATASDSDGPVENTTKKEESSKVFDRVAEDSKIIVEKKTEKPVANQVEVDQPPLPSPTIKKEIPVAQERPVEEIKEENIFEEVEVATMDIPLNHIDEPIRQDLETEIVYEQVIEIDDSTVEEIVTADEGLETVEVVATAEVDKNPEPTPDLESESLVDYIEIIEPVEEDEFIVAEVVDDETTQDRIEAGLFAVDEAVPEESDERDDLFENIASQLGLETDQSPILTSELSRDVDADSEMITENTLVAIVEEVDVVSEGEQSAIEKQLAKIVRSIEILKYARTAEECKDAVEDLKSDLTAYFEEMGYDDPGRMALELLNDYHMRAIDEAMNEALKIARSKRSHSHVRVPVRTYIIGRHVVSLLFGTVSDNLFLRSVFFAEKPVANMSR